MKYKHIKVYLILIVLNTTIGLQLYAQHNLNGLWAKRAAFGSSGSATITSSTLDEQGNVYVAGVFSGTLNFSDDICTPKMRTASTGTASSLFVIKYDNKGKYQWDIVFKAGDATNRAQGLNSLHYANGRLLFNGFFNYSALSLTLPMNIDATGTVNNKTISSPAVADGSPVNQWYHFFMQVIDCSTGKLLTDISKFPTGCSDIHSARIEGDDVVAVHFGFASIYPTSSPASLPNGRYSIVSSYKLSSDAESHTVNFENKYYPNQPLSTNPGNSDGSRVRSNITLANGSQILVHYAQDYTDIEGVSGVPSYYLVKYSNNFSTHNKTVLLTARATDAHRAPKISCDASNNVYLMMDFGHSKYWRTQNDIANSNTLTDFLGSGTNYSTAAQHNKIVLARIDQNLDYTPSSWAVQIGTTGTTGTDMVYGNDIKVVGNYTYIVGRFKGSNVPFGNGKTLSSNGDFDGFYAVYDNANGNCVYAVNMGGTDADNNATLCLSPDAKQVLIGGTYVSPNFQSDPSNQLYELLNGGATQQGFITLYSTIQSTPISVKSSFGDAPESYGLAVHHASECLRIGKMDLAKIQGTPVHSIKADVAENDDGLKITVDGNGYADLRNGDLQLDASGDLTAVVKVHNNTLDDAKIIGWFDFNENGVFDGASEASTIVVVSKNTIAASATVKLRWVGASAKLRSGQTYMRLRITSDNMDETQPQGLFFNGEVEDYGVKLNLLWLDKTVLDKNSVNISEANVGDTISYSINIGNGIMGDVRIFDPIPEYTQFVDASNGGTTRSVTIGGVTHQAVVWDYPNMPPTATLGYSFRVVVTGKPKHSDSIYNIAFATMNGDTINSAQATCNINGVEVNKLVAQNDYYAVLAGDSIMAAPISLNDTDPQRNFVRDTILVVYNGTAEINEPRNGTLKYVSKPNFVGIDSIDYRIKTANDSADAKVYILVTKPLSQKYIACPEAKITLGLTAISGVTYNWYTTVTGGVPVKANSNTHQVIKNNTDFIETWYVEATYNGVVFPRFPIYLHMSDNCGVINPTDCAVEGTLIWTEDFDRYDDGLNPFSPIYSQVSLPAGMTTYNFMNTQGAFPAGGVLATGMYVPGNYAIVKDAIDPKRPDSWLKLFRDDHTYPNDREKGRFFVANGRNLKDQLYKQEINGLCDNISSLYFSFWTRGYHAELKWTIYSSDTDEVLSVLSLPPMLDSSLVNKELTWQHYGFMFEIPAGVSGIYFDIYNNCDFSTGNDFAIDDIEIRLCAPPVTINTPIADTVLCPGKSLHFEGDYTDNPITFGNDLVAKWQFSKTGNINVESEWSNIGVANTSSTGSIVAVYDIVSMSETDEGYYRIIVGKPTTIDMPNCRVMSKAIHVSLNNSPSAYPEIRVQACPDNGLINLSKYVDNTNLIYLAWSVIAGPAIGATTGIVNSADFVEPFTYIYNYKVKNACYEPESKLYVRTIKDKVFSLPPDTVVICKEIKSATHLNINAIVGIEADGSWLFDNTVNPDDTVFDNTHLSVAPAVYAGAYTFNAAKAWNEAGAAYLVPGGHNGDMNAKMFKFRYTTTAASCVGLSAKDVVVIVTEKLVP